jgi:hypothetical protein
MKRPISRPLIIAFAALTACAMAQAQATRTWVSGVGDDANPCSRTAPCKTFAGAISKTAAGGEISVLDPGGFGAVTITKGVTLDGDGTLAGVLVSGTNGIVVSAGPSDVVILRNLSINGVTGSGLSGIYFTGGGTLIVENCTIYGFSVAGIRMAHNGTGKLVVSNSSITSSGTGVLIESATTKANIQLDHVSIQGSVNGVQANVGFTEIRNSILTMNTGVGVQGNGGTVNIEGCMFTGNANALQSKTKSTIRIANNAFYDNGVAFLSGGGTLLSQGNNRKGNNVGGTGTSVAPTGTITLQ